MANQTQASSLVLQIVPREPGSRDGVGDYALNLAHCLKQNHDLITLFLVAQPTSASEKDGFRILSGLIPPSPETFSAIIVHYANYGYDRRGIPLELRDFMQTLRAGVGKPCLTVFHEIYASGPPWRSAFWTRSGQVRVARDLIDLSTACIVSNEVIKREIRRYDGKKPVSVLPVMSNFGEGIGISEKRPRRWAICGGTKLLDRSLAAFARHFELIPVGLRPNEMELIGGERNDRMTRTLGDVRSKMPEIAFRHHPAIASDEASRLLDRCSFGWLDYFGSGKVWPTMIFKSGSFAALCAHGVIPIFSHVEERLSLEGDPLPGPFFCGPRRIRFPEIIEVPAIQTALQSWYSRNASCKRAAAVFSEAINS